MMGQLSTKTFTNTGTVPLFDHPYTDVVDAVVKDLLPSVFPEVAVAATVEEDRVDTFVDQRAVRFALKGSRYAEVRSNGLSQTVSGYCAVHAGRSRTFVLLPQVRSPQLRWQVSAASVRGMMSAARCVIARSRVVYDPSSAASAPAAVTPTPVPVTERPPAPIAQPRRIEPVRVGGAVNPPRRTKSAPPDYPQIAQASRIQGTVVIEAVIGEDGRVRSARVVKSIRLLDDAALAAVRQWEYSPTLVDNEPVPVMMTVDVGFHLD